MRWIRSTARSLALLCTLMGMAWAEEPAVPDAVGRVNVQGQGFCTGTLIGPRLVITAAHCLFHPRTGEPVRLGDVHFVAGWNRGSFVAHAQPRAMRIDPAYVWQARHAPEGFSHDVAILELREPLPVAPLPVAGTVDPALPMALVHYSQKRPHLAAVSRACRVKDRPGRLWRLDCPVEPGASGAPVLIAGTNGWSIAGIVIGRTETPSEAGAIDVGSLALPLQGALNP